MVERTARVETCKLVQALPSSHVECLSGHIREGPGKERLQGKSPLCSPPRPEFLVSGPNGNLGATVSRGWKMGLHSLRGI